MAKKFVISRFSGGKRLMICWGEFRTEYIEDDPKLLKRCLGYLNLDQSDQTLLAKLKEAVEHFYQLESRSLAKFGPPKIFRIWRVDSKVLQVEFKGGYTELRGQAKSDAVLKKVLEEVLANQILLPDLKRELAEFLQDEDKVA